MKYLSSTAPISRSELDKIICWSYVNPDVCEEDLAVWDGWFMRYRRIPGVFSISNRGKEYRFVAHIEQIEVEVDWRVFRTWRNTFHLRYERLLAMAGLKPEEKHFHPNDLIRVAKLMDDGVMPKPLAECKLEVRS